MKNNALKRELIEFAIANSNFVSVTNHIHGQHIETSDFSIVVMSSATDTDTGVLHHMRFNYHCKLLEFSITGEIARFTDTCASSPVMLKAREIHRRLYRS